MNTTLIEAINTVKQAKENLFDAIGKCFYDAIAEMETLTIFNEKFLRFELNEFRCPEPSEHAYPSELMEYFYGRIWKAYKYATAVRYCSDKQGFPAPDRNTTVLDSYNSVAKDRALRLEGLINATTQDYDGTLPLIIDEAVYFLVSVLRASIIALEEEVKIALSAYEELTDEDKELAKDRYADLKSLIKES